MNEPNLIRNDTPHQVSMPEGTNVAVGKKATAQEATVRKVLASAEETINEFAEDETRVLVPEAEQTKSAEEQPSFKRQLDEGVALAPAAVDTGHVAEAIVDLRVETEHMALLPDTLPEKSAVAFVPEDLPSTRPEQGPLIQHSEQDRFVPLPDPVSETMDHHHLPAPEPEPDEPVTEQAAAAETDTPELSDTMLTMLQMDFPARVVKLKIENDKVRSKLDALQDSARS
jgi:hypothetical protein